MRHISLEQTAPWSITGREIDDVINIALDHYVGNITIMKLGIRDRIRNTSNGF